MKLFAKVKNLKGDNAKELILAFFKEFKEENCIRIQGNEAIIEFNCDSVPEAMSNAIANCDLVQFICGQLSDECKSELQLVEGQKNPKNPKPEDSKPEDSNN